jgi:hypothetical protein
MSLEPFIKNKDHLKCLCKFYARKTKITGAISVQRSGAAQRQFFKRKQKVGLQPPARAPKAARQQFLAFYTKKVTSALKNVSMRKQC